jgi:phosphoribosylformylglycinamidine synthase PurS subunit
LKKTRVVITIKDDILDPAGVAVKKALLRQGFLDLSEVRIGKVVDLTFSRKETDDRLLKVKQAAESLLSNPIMENFTIEVIDEQ